MVDETINNGDPTLGSAADFAVLEVETDLSAVLGRAELLVSQLLKLGRGAVVVLDRGIDDPIDLLVNGKLVARGEVVVVDDHLAITLTDVIKSQG